MHIIYFQIILVLGIASMALAYPYPCGGNVQCVRFEDCRSFCIEKDYGDCDVSYRWNGTCTYTCFCRKIPHELPVRNFCKCENNKKVCYNGKCVSVIDEIYDPYTSEELIGIQDQRNPCVVIYYSKEDEREVRREDLHGERCSLHGCTGVCRGTKCVVEEDEYDDYGGYRSTKENDRYEAEEDEYEYDEDVEDDDRYGDVSHNHNKKSADSGRSRKFSQDNDDTSSDVSEHAAESKGEGDGSDENSGDATDETPVVGGTMKKIDAASAKKGAKNGDEMKKACGAKDKVKGADATKDKAGGATDKVKCADGMKDKAGGATDKVKGADAMKDKAGGAKDKVKCADGMKDKAGGATDKVKGADARKDKAGGATDKVKGADAMKDKAGGATDMVKGAEATENEGISTDWDDDEDR